MAYNRFFSIFPPVSDFLFFFLRFFQYSGSKQKNQLTEGVWNAKIMEYIKYFKVMMRRQKK